MDVFTVFGRFCRFCRFYHFLPFSSKLAGVGNRSPFFKMHPRDLSKYDVFFLFVVFFPLRPWRADVDGLVWGGCTQQKQQPASTLSALCRIGPKTHKAPPAPPPSASSPPQSASPPKYFGKARYPLVCEFFLGVRRRCLGGGVLCAFFWGGAFFFGGQETRYEFWVQFGIGPIMY